MSPLKNAKWENFAMAKASGMTAGAAYQAAGYTATGNGAEVNASKLLKNPDVARRIDEIKAQRAEKTADVEALTKLWVIDRLMRNARICMGEEPIKQRVRPKGAPDTVVELEVTDRDPSAANQALTLLGKELGMFVDRTENTNTNTTRLIADKPVSEEEWLAQHASTPEPRPN